jgi:hypothetical protein
MFYEVQILEQILIKFSSFCESNMNPRRKQFAAADSRLFNPEIPYDTYGNQVYMSESSSEMMEKEHRIHTQRGISSFIVSPQL